MRRQKLGLWVGLWAGLAPALWAQPTYQTVGFRTVNQVQNLANAYGLPSFLFAPQSGVRAYRMSYTMPFLGEEVLVSGAVFEPTDLDPGCALPVHIYMHGTVFERDDVPSFLNGEGNLGFLMASLGFTVLMPDYVGLGIDDQHLHPYVHAQSEADAGAYMIAALHEAPEANPSGNLHDATQLFVSGYSQGGHAAMALHRTLQEDWPQYPVTAAAPQSGPYDISGTQFPWTFASESYSNPAYLAYVALAWQSIYGDLYTELTDYFQEPYASLLPGLFDGQTSANTINNALPALTADFAQPGLFASLLAPGSPFLAAAQDNDTYDWVPEAPVKLYYCTEDEQVYYANAEFAHAHMTGAGAQEVSLVDLGAFDHGDCAGQAIFGATLWFSQLAATCGPETVAVAELDGSAPEASSGAWRLVPNPAQGGTELRPMRGAGGAQEVGWTVWAADGRRAAAGHGRHIPLGQCAPGLYVVTLSDGSSLRLSVR